jgi:aminoglycoside phosphotransferase family enzyme
MPEPGLTEKVAFLCRPEAYASRPTRVELKETHMSCLFLTDRYVWKLKKPARYDYLDFSTVEARKADCELEVELNRRLAPEVYLGILPLVSDPHGRMQLGGEGRIVDWLVLMRRLPEDRMLDAAIRTHTVSRDDVRRVGGLLARFYQHAKRIPLSRAAYTTQLETVTAECARELCKPVYALSTQLIERICTNQMIVLKRETAMFDDRVRKGKIVDAHGDLRPEHICLGPEPVIIDCLEFNEEFRMLDPVSELAFLSLECERLDAPWVGEVILDTYQCETGDRPPGWLLVYYKKHHALVRAKIAVWHLKDPDVREPIKWIGKAKDYLCRASSFEELHD